MATRIPNFIGLDLFFFFRATAMPTQALADVVLSHIIIRKKRRKLLENACHHKLIGSGWSSGMLSFYGLRKSLSGDIAVVFRLEQHAPLHRPISEWLKFQNLN